jgi:heterodisulfide reductase subunit C
MVRCPRGIDIPKVMEAMRQVQLRDNVDKVDLNKLTPEQLAQMPQIALVSGFRKMTS